MYGKGAWLSFSRASSVTNTQLLYCALWSREVRQRDKSTAHARVQRGKPRNSLGGDKDQARGETRGRQRVEKEEKMLQPVATTDTEYNSVRRVQSDFLRI